MIRRNFLAIGTASYQRILGANGRVGMALIGSGRRGREVMSHFLRSGKTELVTTADVYDVQRQRARAAFEGLGSGVGKEAVDYREALDNKEVDAVLIATPDHLHVTQAVDALAAGKHVYLEKPTLHRWSERQALETAAYGSKCVLQCGTQQRSGAHYAQARETYFASGKLGKVVLARAVWHNFPWQTRKIGPQARPAGLDWERFVGPARKVPYDWIRYDSWRYFSDYGGGLLADILTHWVDVAQWMMGDAAPLDAVSTGGIYSLKDGRENPDTVSAILRYDGWNLSFESSVLSLRNDQPGVLFEGTEGLLELTRSGYRFTPREGEPVVVQNKHPLEVAHTLNFLEAIDKGVKVNAGLREGLEATLPVQMALEAYRSGKRVGPKFNL